MTELVGIPVEAGEAAIAAARADLREALDSRRERSLTGRTISHIADKIGL